MAEFKELSVSNDVIDDADELRRRMKDEGYLFFRKLQDPDKLWSLRLDMLEVMREGGWLKAGTELADGIADLSHRCTEDTPRRSSATARSTRRPTRCERFYGGCRTTSLAT